MVADDENNGVSQVKRARSIGRVDMRDGLVVSIILLALPTKLAAHVNSLRGAHFITECLRLEEAARKVLNHNGAWFYMQQLSWHPDVRVDPFGWLAGRSIRDIYSQLESSRLVWNADEQEPAS